MKSFANETACVNRVLIWHICIYLKLSTEKNRIEVSFCCRKNRIGCHVPVRVNAPVRANRPRKSYPAYIFPSPEQMLGKFSILCISTLTRLQYVLFDKLNKYFIAQMAENTFILH